MLEIHTLKISNEPNIGNPSDIRYKCIRSESKTEVSHWLLICTDVCMS